MQLAKGNKVYTEAQKRQCQEIRADAKYGKNWY